jgi:hypothetical protein
MNNRMDRQAEVGRRVKRYFGVEQSTSLPQRGLRLSEEAIETAQACRVDKAQLHALVDYVYARPVGEISQECGGVSLTLLALGEAAGVDIDTAERDELTRFMSKSDSYWHERNELKNAAGFVDKSLAAIHPEPTDASWEDFDD